MNIIKIDIDKSWISRPRGSIEYKAGLNKFLDFAFANASSDGMIHCPCPSCGFRLFQTREDAYDHLLLKPFPAKYTFRLHHGERHVGESSTETHETDPGSVYRDPMRDMVREAFNFPDSVVDEDDSSNKDFEGDAEELPYLYSEPSQAACHFDELLEDGEQELYPGCAKFSKLAFLVRLYHIKCMCGVSDKAFGMILELLCEAFEHAKILASLHDAKRIIRKLGIAYKKIDACPNDCMLYQGSDQVLSRCKICGTSRWKQKTRRNSIIRINVVVKKKGKPQAAKVLRYFSLVPRLQRMFMSSKTSVDMLWHKKGPNSDGFLRRPRDGEAWKAFDRRYTHFSGDPRSVRLALASDGFNPFENLSSRYSIWPPLIDELKQLWRGVDTYDASEKKTFKLHAALMWTISDFSGLGNLSGWNTYGGRACPTCNLDAESKRLTFSQKWCFMGHRRFLKQGHRFRQDRVRFDGKVEARGPPVTLSGGDILRQLDNVHVKLGKVQTEAGKRARGQQAALQDESSWKKRSIFFELPYWEYNLLRHNMDVMHIEKNMCDNIIYTILNDSGKSKDNLKARKDLQLMEIRHELWPRKDGKYPTTIFSISNSQKDVFLRNLKNVVFPDGHSSNISRCIDLQQRKISGLKSHDSHILMEHLLLIAIRNVLEAPVAASWLICQLSLDDYAVNL
ncbi:uncharacterized protein LOC107647150 [Arachis ipaensis]|uniref:uncharacterized protein LOC107647150 n=1 Tax=Arachis ipaensis TaxID=130454 RepID=UPI0007AFDC2A|nr:uncharacterized protein LOC107647150 [Arachis ipaensis]XP_025661757.1 uncharacterized protein LOC112757385 [Arachis hypogaea]